VTAVPNALLVIDNPGAHGGVLQTELEALGYAVALKDSSAVAASDAQGRNLIYISPRTATVGVGALFQTTAVPIIVANPTCYGDRRMTPTTAGSSGTAANQAKIVILNWALGHPLAAGLNGDTAVQTSTSASSYAWGKPPSSAVRVASLAADPVSYTVFAYDTG